MINKFLIALNLELNTALDDCMAEPNTVTQRLDSFERMPLVFREFLEPLVSVEQFKAISLWFYRQEVLRRALDKVLTEEVYQGLLSAMPTAPDIINFTGILRHGRNIAQDIADFDLNESYAAVLKKQGNDQEYNEFISFCQLVLGLKEIVSVIEPYPMQSLLKQMIDSQLITHDGALSMIEAIEDEINREKITPLLQTLSPEASAAKYIEIENATAREADCSPILESTIKSCEGVISQYAMQLINESRDFPAAQETLRQEKDFFISRRAQQIFSTHIQGTNKAVKQQQLLKKINPGSPIAAGSETGSPIGTGEPSPPASPRLKL